ncbi:MAG: thioredoxin family protein [Bacteroidota bacterium]
MKQSFLLLLISILLMSAKNPDREGIEFFRGSFTSAKAKAAEEGKLFFLDFTASWCTPCRWMEETTFTDPTLAAYVKENYVALQVDIDDFDGYALKQKYNIQILPSLLIFSSQGVLLAQYEESLSSRKMLDILKKYDDPSNRVVSHPIIDTYPTTNERPSNEIILPVTIMVNDTPTADKNEPMDYTVNNPPTVGGITRKPLVKKERRLVSIPETTEEIARPQLHNKPSPTTYQEEVTYTTYDSAPIKTKEEPNARLTRINPYSDSGEGLYRFKVYRQPSSGFSVQVGAYAEYGNVLRQASMLQQQFGEAVIVHISKKSNRTLYKLMLGEFSTRSQAIDFMRTVQAKGVDCMIKNLSIY